MAIIVYSTPTCPWCKKAKEYLASRGVAYEERDVTTNRAWIEELRARSGQLGVPVITDGTRVVVGFDKAGLDALASPSAVVL